MGRIEKDEHMKEELSQMKGEVVKEMRKVESGRGKLTCSLLFWAFVFGLGGWFAWICASTGLFNVPVFSRFAYEDPIPVRVVIAGSPLETVIQENLETILVRRIQQGGGKLTDTSVSLTLDESAFTSTLQSSLEASGMDYFDTDRVQIAILENGTFEIFLPLKDRAKQTALIVDVEFELINGGIGVKTKTTRLGSFVFPRILIDFFADTIIKPQLPALNSSLGQYAKIDSVSYTEGQITMNGDFDVKVVE